MNESATSSACLSPEDRRDIQGFVTSGFGHLAHMGYFFVHFQDPAKAKAWLARLLPGLTTARSWRPQPGLPKEKPAQVTNVALSIHGLRFLGMSPRDSGSFAPEFREGMTSKERALILGDIGDSASKDWQVGGPDGPEIHALIVRGDASRESVQKQSAQWRQEMEDQRIGMVVAEEWGELPSHGREHFGFRDGIAQPQIKGIRGEGVNTGEFILGYANEYGYHPVSPSVSPEADPARILPNSPNPYQAGKRDFGRNGTYLVYRKLEQNVAGFWRFMAEESSRRHGRTDPGFMIWLAAKMVGRWPGGAPLTLSPEFDDPELERADAFGYSQWDAEGLRCPFGAHIRRTNPRDQLGPAPPEQSQHMTARHLLLRRGRLYGDSLFDSIDQLKENIEQLIDGDAIPRGIHFLCLNASIKSQFEFVQQAWMNNPGFNGLDANPDPMTSRSTEQGAMHMHVPDTALGWRTAAMPRWVTVRGGGYFFMPGLRALRWLVTANPS